MIALDELLLHWRYPCATIRALHPVQNVKIKMSGIPLISIVVPLQEHLCFDQLLVALAEQENIALSEFEVIGVDSLYLADWPEKLVKIKQQYPGLQVSLKQIERTRSRAKQLNIGVNEARANVLLLLADDFIPCRNIVSFHLKTHRADQRKELVAIGPGFFPADQRTTEFMHWLEDSGELFGVKFTDSNFRLPPNYFYMGNVSLKAEFLDKAGKFDEEFPYDAMDDWEMGLRLQRLGMVTQYVPEAIATHEHFLSVEERCRAMRQAGETSAIYDARLSTPRLWQMMVSKARRLHPPPSSETKQQYYQRILNLHWLKGYAKRNPDIVKRN